MLPFGTWKKIGIFFLIWIVCLWKQEIRFRAFSVAIFRGGSEYFVRFHKFISIGTGYISNLLDMVKNSRRDSRKIILSYSSSKSILQKRVFTMKKNLRKYEANFEHTHSQKLYWSALFWAHYIIVPTVIISAQGPCFEEITNKVRNYNGLIWQCDLPI